MNFFIGLLCSLALVSWSLSCRTEDNDNVHFDIIFVVDGSASIGAANFELVKTWLDTATTSMFNTFGSRAHFEVLQYSNMDPPTKHVPIAKSTLFAIPFRLGECESTRCMKSRISHMEYLNGHTYTYYALRRAMEVEFVLSAHYPSSKKVLILLTDGAATDGTLLPLAFEASVKENITNFVIGVGNYSEEELKISANGGVSNERVFTSADYRSLSSVSTALELDFIRQGFFCDECRSGSHNCSIHATCINKPDSFRCECNAGYFGDGVTCQQFDFCGNNPCSDLKHSYCVVMNNRPHCVCKEGFREQHGSCVDINECESGHLGAEICEMANTVCHNIDGGHLCLCAEGYEIDGHKCIEKQLETDSVIVIVTFSLAILIIIALIIFIVVKSRNRGTFYPQSAGSESEQNAEEVQLYQIGDRQLD